MSDSAPDEEALARAARAEEIGIDAAREELVGSRQILLVVRVDRDSKLDGPLLKSILEGLPHWHEDILDVRVSAPAGGPRDVLRVSLRSDGTVATWLPPGSGGCSAEELAETLRWMADHFESGDVRRIR